METIGNVDDYNHLFWVSLFSIAFASVDVDLSLFFQRRPLPPTAQTGIEEQKYKKGPTRVGQEN
jgi:hypothetical protein